MKTYRGRVGYVSRKARRKRNVSPNGHPRKGKGKGDVIKRKASV